LHRRAFERSVGSFDTLTSPKIDSRFMLKLTHVMMQFNLELIDQSKFMELLSVIIATRDKLIDEP